MNQLQVERRLCALVAVDMAGYSGRAETDEAGAVGLVSALSRLVHDTTGTLGGRVFSTAGDGFMLEFPTATGALTAAEAIAAAAPAPVRAGVHLGEVAVAPGDDLLGHGVNVAARLQEAADPGEIMVSDDVKRAVRGPLAERLEPVGRMRLAKMKEERAVYSLKPAGARRRRAPRDWGRWIGVAAGLLVLAAAGAAAWRTIPAARPADELTIAVRSLDSQGPDGPGAAYGAALADRLTEALAERQAPTVSRDRVGRGDLAGARLVIGGTVERDGALLRARVKLDDSKAGLTLWSTSFQRPADQGAALQNQAAINVAEVITGLRNDLGPSAQSLSPEALAAYLNAIDLGRRSRGSFAEARNAFRRLAELAPQDSRVHSYLAKSIIVSLRLTEIPPEMVPRLRAEAQAEAERARALDPRNPMAFLALSQLVPPQDYLARERLLAKARAAGREEPEITYLQADFINEVGRMREGLATRQQVLGLVRYNPAALAGNIFGLAGAGRYDEAKALGDWAAQVMPDNNSLRRANLFTALLYGSPDQVPAAIDRFQAGEARLTPAAEKAWRDYAAARAGALPVEIAVRELLAAPRAENGVDRSTAMSAFSLLGRLDEAFAEAERARVEERELHLTNLFEGAAANMRRDRRFMPLVARFGLAGYWLRSGKWPDFCLAPDAPYDCKAAAQAAMKILS